MKTNEIFKVRPGEIVYFKQKPLSVGQSYVVQKEIDEDGKYFEEGVEFKIRKIRGDEIYLMISHAEEQTWWFRIENFKIFLEIGDIILKE